MSLTASAAVKADIYWASNMPGWIECCTRVEMVRLFCAKTVQQLLRFIDGCWQLTVVSVSYKAEVTISSLLAIAPYYLDVTIPSLLHPIQPLCSVQFDLSCLKLDTVIQSATEAKQPTWILNWIAERTLTANYKLQSFHRRTCNTLFRPSLQMWQIISMLLSDLSANRIVWNAFSHIYS